jgi:predicted outer membrane repeat protein
MTDGILVFIPCIAVPSDDNRAWESAKAKPERHSTRRSHIMRSRTNNLLSVLAAIGLCTPATVGSVLHVDDDAPPLGDGQSWATAYRFLQDALTDARNSGGGVTEIRVAQGLYLPDRNEATPGGTGDQLATFQLVNSVLLAGGYAGRGAPDPDARDVSVYVTTLSGDLAGDDHPDPLGSEFLGYDENSRHVVTGSGNDATAIIDGVTITAGNASVLNSHDGGGGMIIRPERGGEGSPTVRNCRFEYNYAYGGSGIDIWDRSPAISGSTFIGNFAEFNGGAIRCVNVASVTISDCSFIANRSDSRLFGGGGIAVQSPWVKESHVAITGCLFVGNSAVFEGGAIVTTQDGSTTISNSTVVANDAGVAGGGVCTANGGTTIIANSILFSNTSPAEPAQDQIFNLEDPKLATPSTRVSSSNTEGGLGGYQTFDDGGNIDAEPLFVDQSNGDWRLQPGSPCIDAGDNTTVPLGITTDRDGTPRFLNDPTMPDTGIGDCPIVDMGAYERPGGTTGCCEADITGPAGVPDDNVDALDFLLMIGQWGTPCAGSCEADITGPGDAPDGNVDALDFLLLIGQWASPADCH